MMPCGFSLTHTQIKKILHLAQEMPTPLCWFFFFFPLLFNCFLLSFSAFFFFFLFSSQDFYWREILFGPHGQPLAKKSR